MSARNQQIDTVDVETARLNYRATQQIGFGGRQTVRSGFGRDNVRTFLHYQSAAQQGDTAAQNSLGVMYANGIGVDQDYEQAFNWFSKAAEQLHGIAEYNLGVMYTNGDHVVQDNVEAVNWFSRAAERGDIEAQSTLRRFGNIR